MTIVNNYDSINESVPTAYEEYPDLVRDSERYGIVYVFTGNGISSIHRRVSQNLPTIYALKLKDQYDYAAVLNAKTKLTPRDILGRGAINNDGVHEFQTAKIIADDDKMNDFLQEFISKQKEINNTKAKRIPVLPDIVRYSDIENDISDLSNIPIGIYKNDLEIAFLNLQNSLGTVISSNRLPNTLNFSKSLLFVLKEIKGINLLIVDPRKELELNADEFKNYYTDNLDLVTDKMIEFIKKIIDAKSDQKVVIFIYNVSKYLAKLEDSKKLNDLFNAVKGLENISIIIVDDAIKLKALQFEEWFKLAFSSTDGVWIGKGVSEQSLFRLSVVNKEMMKELKNDMGYVVSESRALLCKYIDFISEDEGDKNGE